MTSSQFDSIIYLDNAATTFPKPAVVYRAADGFYRRFGGNAGRGTNPLTRKGTELIAETRALLADWLGAPAPERVIFAPSAIVTLNQAILGTDLRPDDIVYLTPFEHNAVLRPIDHLRQSLSVDVLEIPLDRQTYACDLKRLAADFRVDPPTLVCITQASNVCGVMSPVMETAHLAKAANPDAVIVVNEAQTAGLYPLDLQNGLIDAFIFSGHKSLYGPYAELGRPTLHPLWADTMPVLAGRTREDLLSDLAALAPVIARLGGAEAVAETFRAIQDVGRWWP